MKQILKNFLIKLSCLHEWDLYNRHEVYTKYNIPSSTVDTLICKKCGKIKRIKL